MHVHADYNAGWWPTTAPYVTATVRTRTPASAADFDAVAAALGVPPTAPTGHTLSQPPMNTAYLTKKDDDANDELDDIEARQTPFFLVGDIDWQTGEVSNLRPPIWKDSFKKILAAKGLD